MAIKVLTIFGTRPEAIKMAPVVQALKKDPRFENRLCVTAQHRSMLDQVLDLFQITPDHDLNLMKQNQDLYDITSNILIKLRDVLKQEKPDCILVHGDTTTTLAASLSGFYAQIPIGHIEAGLRTGDIFSPFPEEANRSLTSKLARWHFAPTEQNRKNLLAENISPDRIFVSGNTVIDALLWVRTHVNNMPEDHWQSFWKTTLPGVDLSQTPLILITGHRRENFGQGFVEICDALSTIAQKHPNWHLVYPVHLNPNVQKPVYERLANKPNIHLIDPLDYPTFVYLMDRVRFLLTDSGGVQEEAPALKKPVLVMRDKTERMEAVTAGTVRLVGTNREKIIQETEKLITDQTHYAKMANASNPYGDGSATKKILSNLAQEFHL